MGDLHPQPCFQVGGAFHRGGVVTEVLTAAGMADVVPGPPVHLECVGPAEHGRQAVLAGQDVEASISAPGAGAALVRQTPGGGGGGDVSGAGLGLVLHGAVVAQQRVLSQAQEAAGDKQDDQRGEHPGQVPGRAAEIKKKKEKKKK